MGLLEIIILAVVQGITEFLPISSSGHLRAAAEILGIPGSTLAIDVAVHVGTLVAVIIYFWRDIARIIIGVAQFATGARTDGGLLGLFIVVATVPVFIAGFLGRGFDPYYLYPPGGWAATLSIATCGRLKSSAGRRSGSVLFCG